MVSAPRCPPGARGLLALLLLLPLPGAREIRCPSPDITNGRVRPRKETYVYEDEIRIECDPGYALKDKNGLIRCERNGAWHPPLPICEPACEPPARITNGRDDRGWKNDFLVGSSVSYSCNRGWSLVGVSSVRCIAGYWGTPHWDAPVPECKACEPPARISNGRDNRGWENVFLVGSSVTYECDRGWSLVGVSSIRCTAGDGGTPRWDAPVPECKACEPPARIANGRDDRGWKNVFLVGSRVSYSCNRGWSLVGVSSVRCTAGDGGTPRWDASAPECKEIPHCPNPVIEHGKQISIRETEYTVGNRIEFQCESGYILKGSKSIECQGNGTWDLPMPSCIKGEAN